MTLNVQFLTMISMVTGGFYLGMALETFRRLSIIWKDNRFLIYFLELFFWLTQTFLLFYILFQVNAGELRLYVFAACILGFSIYQVIASTLYKKILEHLIRLFTSVFQFLKRLIHFFIVIPITWLINILLIIIIFISQLLVSILFFIGKLLVWPIRGALRTAYKLLPERIQKIFHKSAGFYSIMKNTSIRVLKKLTFKRR